MNHRFLQAVSFVALASTILPSVLYMMGVLDHSTVTLTALVGTFVWFASTPLWMERKAQTNEQDVG